MEQISESIGVSENCGAGSGDDRRGLENCAIENCEQVYRSSGFVLQTGGPLLVDPDADACRGKSKFGTSFSAFELLSCTSEDGRQDLDTVKGKALAPTSSCQDAFDGSDVLEDKFLDPRIISSDRDVPHGFELIANANAVSLYKNANDFVVSVDLAAGAELDLVSGSLLEKGRVSVYGGPNPDFTRMNAETALRKEQRAYPQAICVVNAEFFANLPNVAVPVAFPFKKDGKILSEGFAAVDKHRGKRLTLETGKGFARISSFDNDDISKFRSLNAEDALVSLSPSVNIDGSGKSLIGRTYIGLSGKLADGNYTKALLFVSSASSQKHAENTLKDFGAGPVMMLDGGGSSQLNWAKQNLVKTTRGVPNFLAVIPAPQKP